MLEIQLLRDQRERTLKGLRKRGLSEERLAMVDQIVKLDEQRKEVQTELDSLLNERNTLSDQIGGLFKKGEPEQANQLKARVQEIRELTDTMESKLQETKTLLDSALVTLPNIPHISVPEGRTAEDNKVHREWKGNLPALHSGAQSHWDLAEKYNLLDFKLGANIAGSGFPLFRGKGARLQRALVNYFLDQARNAGYEEV